MPHDDAVISEILQELKNRGVNTAGLIVLVRQQYVLISGQVDNFYSQQLLQEFMGTQTAVAEFKIDVTVDYSIDKTGDFNQPPDPQTHLLRNRLNKFLLGTRLLKRALADDDIPQAVQIVDRLLDAEHQPESSRALSAPKGIGDKTILVIEDDLNQCLLLSGLLQQLGASVTHRRCAESARSAIGSGLRPDVMLVDLNLTGESGTAFAKWFRDRDADDKTMLIAVSASQPDPDPSPFDQWIPKPINIEKLIKSIVL